VGYTLRAQGREKMSEAKKDALSAQKEGLLRNNKPSDEPSVEPHNTQKILAGRFIRFVIL